MKEYVLMEAASSTAPKKKYKCPYCDGRFERNKLHIHIQNKHEDMIPEGYTALRVAFNTINHKTEGHCIMCGAVTDWNEDKGRYERLCNNQACHDAYKKMAADRNKNKYGTERLQSDPRYAEEVQRKALAGRRIAGTYRFTDGGTIDYIGTYEKKLLEFMDKVMMCKSEDIVAPGPALEYEWEGAKHIYLPDFYYIPYNLLIEIKDGGSNPNKNPAMQAYKTERQEAKEAAVKATKKFNYVRLTDNNFGQLLQIMAVLKYNLQNDCYDPIMRVNEGMMIEESTLHGMFKSDKELSDWMKKNIHYKNFTKLMTADEVMEQKAGSCHDQVVFELEHLKNMGYKPKAEFIIELDNSGQGGMTHSFVYYDKNGKTYWFENAWEDMTGIHEYTSKNELFDAIEKMHDDGKFGNVEKYKALNFAPFGKHESGESLQDFVDVCFEEALIFESTDESHFIDNFEKKNKVDYEILSLQEALHHSAVRQNPEMYANIEHWAKNKDGEVLIDTINNSVIGYVCVSDHVNEEYDGKTLGPLFVYEKYRGMGFADTLMWDAINEWNPTVLGVYCDNEVAIELYRKFGFRISKLEIYKDGSKYYIMRRNSSLSETDMAGTIAAALPLTPTPTPHESDPSNYYIVQHPQNNVFAYGITKDPLQYQMYSVDPQEKGFYKVFKSDKGKIDKKYLTFKIKDKKAAKELYDELALIESFGTLLFDNKYEDPASYIYSRLTNGSKLLTEDQILFDDRFELVRSFDEQLDYDCQKLYKYFLPNPIDVLKEQVTDLEEAIYGRK